MSPASVAVVGSANMDIVFSVDRIPQPGETTIASSTARYPGGKGLNQAVAAARAGLATVFIGALGDDEHGRELATVMTDAGIDGALTRGSTAATGQAFIAVDAAAENTIVIASGANADVETLTDAELDAIASASVLLMQLELPLSAVEQAAAAGKASGTIVILNAAPAHALSDALIGDLDCLIVNEPEAIALAGSDDPETASRSLAVRVPRLVVTLGASGSVLFEAGQQVARVPARVVSPVDTTGAGDTFCGAFAAALAEGREFVAAAEFATVAASLSVQALGAVPSIPTRADIEAAL
ncbi:MULTISPECIES: ribokinase [unclassified Cryobacterium]|uniref:ribokinase n=1 Tax=unclassified Cryobacterium TaxID=2649013 RepID=UPI0014488F4F|nr:MULTISPECIES: ribokinase [unclassified Cryobacterium]